MQLQLSYGNSSSRNNSSNSDKNNKAKRGKSEIESENITRFVGLSSHKKDALVELPTLPSPSSPSPSLSLAPLNRPQVRNLTEATVPGVWLCLRLRAEYPAPSCCHRVPPSAECRVQSAECSLYFVRSSLLPVPSFQFLVASAKCQVQRHVQVH